jgi:hypothetical protein
VRATKGAAAGFATAGFATAGFAAGFATAGFATAGFAGYTPRAMPLNMVCCEGY